MNRLRDKEIRPGDRWVYSAGFNVAPDLRDTVRIDAELPDLERILHAGGRVAILSHQGSHGDADELDHVAAYLTDRLGSAVGYVRDNDTAGAARLARALRPGTATLFGNTRRHAGEQRNDPELARRFAALGDAVAVGGFSKAHRAHASNAGILRFLPGYVTDSVLREVALLEPWAGVSDRFSVAVLGGVKREKTVIGLDAVSRAYDVVVPGGVVLNSLLRALGHDVGASDLGDDPDGCLRVARAVLGRANRARIHIPRHVVVTRGGAARTVAVEQIPPGWSIADLVPLPWLRDALTRLVGDGGRAFIAGTPCRYAAGFRDSAEQLLAAFAAPGVDALLMGGDTIAELPWEGRVSTGGGAALHFLAHGTCPVLDAVRTGSEGTT
ncbi:phosphoglycerate kinase [Saccharothrix algeriensis]|uniref:Phosphoglycerate kinase n=1 Tax=Saccharothrix algeriensis TaxID=173560 RepID=A0A8T8HWG2_9PSEU|nr:phosphoglycerate kinase [Saccharothrix algeriensis]MBM7814458.1 phosphoglycerate kinase [Saccharothrix algeriensis]QTR02757.1 phosphoglycerate kinase [Saccharothrix algeriensis]